MTSLSGMNDILPATVLADFILRWPEDLFRVELARLVNQHQTEGWHDEAKALLGDAFTSNSACEQFAAASHHNVFDPPGPGGGRAFLVALLRSADRLPVAGRKRPYYSQRKAGVSDSQLTHEVAVSQFMRTVQDLDARGYFDRIFGLDCVDDMRTVSPRDVIAAEVERKVSWPLLKSELVNDPDLLLDLVEVLHDFAGCPRSRTFHDWSNCGWHYGDFSITLGQGVYRWTVNQILDRTSFGLRLADDGEDVGRLVGTTDESRTTLAAQMASREDPATGDDVRHALALFRGRGATIQDKRSACISLAGVLEQRRTLIKAQMLSKDEGALFQIANGFAIRHQSEQQKADYDPLFLDWVFWVYLSSIELTDGLMARS